MLGLERGWFTKFGRSMKPPKFLRPTHRLTLRNSALCDLMRLPQGDTLPAVAYRIDRESATSPVPTGAE